MIAARKYPNRYSIVCLFVSLFMYENNFNCAVHCRAVCVMNRTNVLHPFGECRTAFHDACSLHTGPSKAMLLHLHTTQRGALLNDATNASDCCCSFRTNANLNCSFARNTSLFARFILPAAMYRRCNRITASSHLFVFAMVVK